MTRLTSPFPPYCNGGPEWDPCADNPGCECDNGTMPEAFENLHKALVGRKIVEVEKVKYEGRWDQGYDDPKALFHLDDGTVVKVGRINDCCALGTFDLENVPKEINARVMAVEAAEDYSKAFILTEGPLLTADTTWSPGNPFWYSYGFWVKIEEAQK